MPSPTSDKFEVTILSDPANVSSVRKSIEQFCAAAGFDQPAQHEVGLVVNEALANVIRHAYGGAKDKPVQFTAQRIGDGVKISIRDWGNGENPIAKAPARHNPLRPGGVGLICMKQLMEQVTFHPQADGMLLEMVHGPHANGV